MNTNGLPNDLLSNLNPISLVIFIPIFDLLIFPFFRKVGINFTYVHSFRKTKTGGRVSSFSLYRPIKKITAGFITAGLAMMCAAIVQDQMYVLSILFFSSQPFLT